jgi:hypothetical protein
VKIKRREFLKKGALAVAGASVAAAGGTASGGGADYIKVVEDLHGEAASNPATAKMIKAGVANLDHSTKGKFAAQPTGDQVAALKKLEHTPFFEKVRSTEMVSLYGNEEVWKIFGYQGASYRFGGYLHHGFNDLTWLPDPPEAASPKPD